MINKDLKEPAPTNGFDIIRRGNHEQKTKNRITIERNFPIDFNGKFCPSAVNGIPYRTR
ncbi:hypothetical protein PL11201_550059 [Planktothrix sp. PCC 11201]|nr:hypothetical protein PL11201_550059 [Planktothrix sp. PCC 11201]